MTQDGKPVSYGLRVGSRVWIASVWNKSQMPVQVTITRIWKGASDRYRHYYFTPKVHGDTFFGWNGTTGGKYQSAYRTKQEALDAR